MYAYMCVHVYVCMYVYVCVFLGWAGARPMPGAVSSFLLLTEDPCEDLLLRTVLPGNQGPEIRSLLWLQFQPVEDLH